MKKFISVLLTVILCFSAVTAFAQTPLFDESQSMMGDANENGKVTAADARIVLRVAAKIDPADSIICPRCDLFSVREVCDPENTEKKNMGRCNEICS